MIPIVVILSLVSHNSKEILQYVNIVLFVGCNDVWFLFSFFCFWDFSKVELSLLSQVDKIPINTLLIDSFLRRELNGANIFRKCINLSGADWQCINLVEAQCISACTSSMTTCYHGWGCQCEVVDVRETGC